MYKENFHIFIFKECNLHKINVNILALYKKLNYVIDILICY